MFAAWILYTGTLDEKLDLLELEVILYFELCGDMLLRSHQIWDGLKDALKE